MPIYFALAAAGGYLTARLYRRVEARRRYARVEARCQARLAELVALDLNG